MAVANSLETPLLTDLYQLTMAYGHWKNGTYNQQASFDLFFRKAPFGGEYAVFAGAIEVHQYLKNYTFNDDDIAYLREQMPNCEEDFFDWLQSIDCSAISVSSMIDGTVCFPGEPLLRVEGPIGIAQLLETPLLALVNYATLVATNAARYRYAAGETATLLEFGLRRAQGPDGGVSASRYSYIGGFDGTSNVLAGKMFGIPVRGTFAHAWVQAYSSLDELGGDKQKLLELAWNYRTTLGFENTNDGELASFVAYAYAYPDGFLALVDTYDTLASGVPNFLCVAFALDELGYRPRGIRLDSGDLAHLSVEARRIFKDAGEICDVDVSGYKIVASNEISEDTLWSLINQKHEIDIFGIGTHLVTAKGDPSLGGVYKLVEIDGNPVIKLSQDKDKGTIPGAKAVFRLYGREGRPILDLLQLVDEPPPRVGGPVMCRHPFEENKRVIVRPASVRPLHHPMWPSTWEYPHYAKHAKLTADRDAGELREDHKRPLNPTPYKVSVSEKLYDLLHTTLMEQTPLQVIE